MSALTYREIRQWPGLLSAFALTAVLAAVLTMATALSVSDFLQLLFPSVAAVPGGAATPVEEGLMQLYRLLVAQGTQRALILYAVLLLLLYGLKNLCSYASAVSFAGVKVRVMRSLRNRLHAAAMAQPFKGWSSQAQGQWLSRMTSDMVEYEVNVLDSIQLLVQSMLTMLLYVAMLLYLDWKMTLLVVVVMGIGAALLTVSRRLKRQSRQLQAMGGELMTLTQETLDSLKEIKAATAIDYVNERQREQNVDFTRRRIGIYRRIYAASPISDFVGNTIVVAILMVGAYRILGDSVTLSPALFVSYIMIYVLLLTPIKEVSNAIAQIKKGRGVEDRLEEVLSQFSAKPVRAPAKTDSSMPANAAWSLRDVTFSYATTPILDHLSLDIPMGCHTAIVGESGSGKTTLGRLLVGLLEADGASGISGEQVAYIPQEAMLFNDTIEANIRFGRPGISDEQVAAAARMAQLEPLLAQLPSGLHTVIGDGGSRLSGGERQRINIARALAGNPKRIVMDEATAALDAATEEHFIQSLRSELPGATLVVIAHRASTIAHCDHVYDVEKKGWLR